MNREKSMRRAQKIVNQGIKYAEGVQCLTKHVAMVTYRGKVLWHDVNKYCANGTMHAEERALQFVPRKYREKGWGVQGSGHVYLAV